MDVALVVVGLEAVSASCGRLRFEHGQHGRFRRPIFGPVCPQKEQSLRVLPDLVAFPIVPPLWPTEVEKRDEGRPHGEAAAIGRDGRLSRELP